MRATNGMEQLPGPMGVLGCKQRTKGRTKDRAAKGRSNMSRFGNVVLSVR